MLAAELRARRPHQRDHCRIRAGELRRAPDAPPLPPWLVIEAVGSWPLGSRWRVALRHPTGRGAGRRGASDRRRRRRHPRARSPDYRLDSRAVLYSGSAALRPGDRGAAACVGPLLPAHTFDDPGSLRQRFAALSRGRCRPEPEAPRARCQAPSCRTWRWQTVGNCAAAHSGCGPIFADHFPRRLVSPRPSSPMLRAKSPRRWRRRLSALHRRKCGRRTSPISRCARFAAGPGVGPRRRDATIRGRHGRHRRLGPRRGQTHRDRRTRYRVATPP